MSNGHVHMATEPQQQTIIQKLKNAKRYLGRLAINTTFRVFSLTVFFLYLKSYPSLPGFQLRKLKMRKRRMEK